MALARIFEALVCTCFYAGICYMLFDGAGKECHLASSAGRGQLLKPNAGLPAPAQAYLIPGTCSS